MHESVIMQVFEEVVLRSLMEKSLQVEVVLLLFL